MIRKTHLAFILSSMVIIVLNGSCKTRSNNSSSDNRVKKEGVTQVNFIGHWLGEGKKEKLLYEIINEFEFNNQNITINMKFAEDIYFDRLKQNVETSFNKRMVLSEKPEWDIIRLNNEYSRVADSLRDPDWTKKYLVDFSAIEEFRNNTRPELLSDTIKALYGGIIPGPFIDGYSWPLWCNTEVAKKVGIEVKQFGMTYDDFLSYVKAVYAYNQSHHDSIIAIYESKFWRTTHTIFQELFFSEIGDYNELMNTKFSENKLRAWEKVLNKAEEIAKYKPLPSNWETLPWTQTINYPLDCKCLFFSNASWMYNMWLKLDSAKLQRMLPTELPVFKPSPLYFGGYFVTWAVLKKSPHREQAIRFLLSMNKPDVAEKWARYTKSPTGIRGNLTTANFGIDKFENFQVTMDKKYGQHKINVSYNSLYILGKEFQGIENCQAEVLSGAMKANQAIQRIRGQLKTRRAL